MNRTGACFLVFILFVVSLQAQSVDSLVTEGAHLEHTMQESGALKKYYAALKLDSENLQALCRASILSTREGNRQTSAKLRVHYYNSASTLAKRALRKNPDDKVANLAMAIALLRLSSTAGAKEKVGGLREVKTYADKALLIDSTYADAWHVLGNWNYVVSSLNFAERAAAKLLFGGLPDASLDKAIAAYQRCRLFNPSFIQNIYDLAKAWHAQSKDLQAIHTLKQAIRLRPILQDDRKIQDECRTMMEKLE